ncbi:GNAT family N-acetyltransferase [Clostridium sp. MCC353]|uniref:GNAT family N-acetyltransferase n=1 Tax=Clostridium sp. MCC353 TaxID=2592646 RepID=UPI001C025937|nr:GNAT family protein [Clostridium sp. MCC353]MBT9779991.1 GNAT family N-acetyltransferase [Clostridium sp. MCC353]
MLRLRPYKACDARYIVTWIKDEKSFHQWSANRFEGLYPLTEESMNQYYEKEAYNDSFWEMTAMDEDGLPVGHFIMRFTDEKKKVIRLGFVVVDDLKRGYGYGKEMIRLAVRYSLDILKADRVTLGVFTNNPTAYHCYKSVGFVPLYTNDRAFRIGNEFWPCTEMEFARRR